MEDIGLGAFSVFFTQSPSFLAHQKAMQDTKGANNAQTLFQVRKIPTANHIRDTLDPVDPKHLFPIYDSVYEALGARGILDTFQGVHNTRLIALDGAWYFSTVAVTVTKHESRTRNTGHGTRLMFVHSCSVNRKIVTVAVTVTVMRFNGQK